MIESVLGIIGCGLTIHQGYKSATLLKRYNLGIEYATFFYSLDAVLLFFSLKLLY
jgi:hypothetical protein